jgi:LacI family transcriptional regulator
MTMNELAMSLGLHKSTVSRALDPERCHLISTETRLKVLRAAAQVGFHPDPAAVGLARGKTMTVGLLAPDLANGTIVQMIRHITDVLDSNGQTALIAESMDDPERSQRLLEGFVARNVDAIATLAATESDRQALRRAADSCPVVLAARPLDGIGLPTVRCDDVRVARLAAEHLTELGHTAIVQLQGPMTSQLFQERTDGFIAACAERAVAVERDRYVADHATTAEGIRLTARLLDESPEPPTAIFAHNDELAFGAYWEVRHRGLSCPEDITIVGVNVTPWAPAAAVGLTSIRYPAEEIGYHTGELLLKLIAGNVPVARTSIFDPELIVNRSSGPPR